MKLTVGSLFSGIGGLELGLERAGMVVKWQVEKDEYARRVLAKHWPDVFRHDDVRTVTGLEHVDVICGGFPCQDISNAGKRKGIEGERSGLWKEYLRIVREVRPRYVLVENVAALRSRGLDVVLGDLAASGYDAEWDCIPAAAVGAPHRRDRIFVVAYAQQQQQLRHEPGRGSGTSGPGANVAANNGDARHVANAFGIFGQPRGPCDAEQGARGRDSGRGGERADELADAERAGLEVGLFQSTREECAATERDGLPGHFWTTEPDVGRVAHGVPKRVDRLRCLGNAVVPQVAEHIGRLILAHAEGRR